MNILFVTHAYPNANGAGWERRAAQHLRALVRLGAVTVVLPWRTGHEHDPAAAGRCRAMGATEIIERDQPAESERRRARHGQASNRLLKAWHALRRMPEGDTRVQPAHRDRYRALLNRPFDAVFAFKMPSAVWLESVMDRAFLENRSVIDLDDVETSVFVQLHAKSRYSPFWRWKLRRQFRWVAATERRLIEQWPAACVCSEDDAKRIEQTTRRVPWIVPNAYAFQTAPDERLGSAANILFVGSFTHIFNVDAMRYFMAEIWPRVTADLQDDARLTLAGFTPPPEIRALGERAGITVIADAPDLDPLYERANIVIAPLLAGSGTRIKLIEAAARGRAIVTTAIGCEGLDFVDGVHAEIADTPEAFAAAIVRLARDPARRAALAAAAYDHARARFDTERIEAELAERIRGLGHAKP